MKKIRKIKNINIYPKQDGSDHYTINFDAIIIDDEDDCNYELHFDFHNCIMNINMDANTAKIEIEPIVTKDQKFPFTMFFKI